jgi:hypothetical protein
LLIIAGAKEGFRLFLQETKTKRGGKTYVSYLVRESFRTANGPRGRTICNLTHLPKEVRDMVGHALRGEALVPLESIEVNNIHSFGGCVVLDDAGRRHGLADWLAPLTPRNASLVRAMVFGGLLTAPSVAPFCLEARAARLAMFCGLDPERERFDSADLAAALEELDDRWAQVRAILLRPPHAEARAIILLRSQAGKNADLGAAGLDAEGIPVPLSHEEGLKPETPGFLDQIASHSKTGHPILAMDEELAARINLERLGNQPYLIDLASATVAALLRQLNQAQLHDALQTGGPIEIRHHGRRHLLIPVADLPEDDETLLRMGSLKELSSISAKFADALASTKSVPVLPAFHGVATNVPPERLPPAAARLWAIRAQAARAAFAPVQIVMGRPTNGDGPLHWRNHRNLQFLIHRLRSHLHGEWSACGETRLVEDVLRDFQEVHRATLTVDGIVLRRLATHPSKTVTAALDRLKLWSLFESTEPGRK